MLQQLLAKVANDLEKNAIPYSVIGGQAVLVYCEPHLTQDIDIALGVGTKRLDEIEREFARAKNELGSLQSAV